MRAMQYTGKASMPSLGLAASPLNISPLCQPAAAGSKMTVHLIYASAPGTAAQAAAQRLCMTHSVHAVCRYTDVNFVNRADCEEYYGSSIPSTTMCAGVCPLGWDKEQLAGPGGRGQGATGVCGGQGCAEALHHLAGRVEQPGQVHECLRTAGNGASSSVSQGRRCHRVLSSQLLSAPACVCTCRHRADNGQ